jgi:benzoate membrane transport protein
MPALMMAVPALMFSIVALSLAFLFSAEANLTDSQTTTLIVGLYGIPGVISLALTFIFRQPLMVAWSTTGVVFLASFAGRFSYNELVGATLVAGVVVALIGLFGLSERLVTILPAPIVFGMLCGIVLPYIVRIFTELGHAPLLIGIPIVVYFLAQRLMDKQMPPLLPAVAAGLVAAWLFGYIEMPAREWNPPIPQGIMPAFSTAAILTISPVIAILIAIQGNLAAVVYLRHENYQPPQRLIDVTTGFATAIVSFFGLGLVTMAAFLTPLTAGPEAGEHRLRHWSVYAASSGFVIIAIFAGVSAIWSAAVPAGLLLSLAGLALIGVFIQALREITRGPLVIGPVLAFAVTASELSIWGLSSVFWALVIGTGVSMLLEGHRLRGDQRRPASG